MLSIRPARIWEARWIAHHLRPEDAQEIMASTGTVPQVAVPDSFLRSSQCLTIRRRREDARPIALYGVADDPTIPNMGVMWLVATQAITFVSLALIKEAPALLDNLARSYGGGLHNYVDARNTLHLRWLDRCGFARIGEATLNRNTFIHVARFTTGV